MNKYNFILYLILLNSLTYFSQTDSVKINNYVKKIDSLLATKSITIKYFDGMSECGGDLKGYYYNTELIYINSVFGIEDGWNEKWIYIQNSKPIYYIRDDIRIILPKNWESYKNSSTDSLGNLNRRPMYSYHRRIKLLNNQLYINTLIEPQNSVIEKNYRIDKEDDYISVFYNCFSRMLKELEKGYK